MLRPNSKEVEALGRLASQPDFQTFTAWLVSSREVERNTAERAPDAHQAVRNLGYSLALGDILDHVEQAQEALRKTGRAF